MQGRKLQEKDLIINLYWVNKLQQFEKHNSSLTSPNKRFICVYFSHLWWQKLMQDQSRQIRIWIQYTRVTICICCCRNSYEFNYKTYSIFHLKLPWHDEGHLHKIQCLHDITFLKSETPLCSWLSKTGLEDLFMAHLEGRQKKYSSGEIPLLSLHFQICMVLFSGNEITWW